LEERSGVDRDRTQCAELEIPFLEQCVVRTVGDDGFERFDEIAAQRNGTTLNCLPAIAKRVAPPVVFTR